MKRHPSLHPLSRDHHEGLMLCRTIQEALEEKGGDLRVPFALFQKEWRGWLPSHFAEEEHWVPKLIEDSELLQRLREEHGEIVRVAKSLSSLNGTTLDAELLGRFATLLHDHIRWEERVLFPAIEQEASESSLKALGEAMRAMEASRPRSCGLPPS